MRHLITLMALGLCTSGSAIAGSTSTIDSRTSTNVTNSITSNNSSSVSSSMDVGGTSSTVTNSIVGRTGSLCSAEMSGKRCEVTCRAPQVAQCGKALEAAEPSCLCK
jgi:hypothetical protein